MAKRKKNLPKKIEERFKALDKITYQTEQEVKRAYAQVLKDIRNELAGAYEKYDMDMHNMQKYKRLEGLEKSIKAKLNDAATNERKAIRQGVKNSYEEAFYHTAFQNEVETQVKLAYTEVNPKVVENVINNKMSGLNWSERVGRNRDQLMFEIKQELAQGLVNGESYTKMSKRLTDRVGINRDKALTIARTETARAQSQGNYDSMLHAEEMGIEFKKQWVATLDDSTRESHEDMDGEVVGMDEYFSNGLEYPNDPGGEASEVINCRCEMITVFEGIENTSRRARDAEGKGELIDYTNYNDWKKDRLF